MEKNQGGPQVDLALEDDTSRRAPDRSGKSNGGDQGGQKSAVKKRTKTGCSTCRKRRIKCDEQKPNCNNCIKSKRQCEYVGQRLVFKEPMGAYGPAYGPMGYFYPPGSDLNAQVAAAAANARNRQQQGPLPFLAPRPPAAGLPQPYPPLAGDPYSSNDSGAPHPYGYAEASGVGFAPSVHVPHGPAAVPHPGFLPQHHHIVQGPHIQMPGDQYSVPILIEAQAAASSSSVLIQPVHAVNIGPHEGPSRTTRNNQAPGAVPIDEEFHPVTSQQEPTRAVADYDEPEDRYWHTDDEASMVDSEEDDEDEDDAFNLERDATNLASNHMGIMVARRLNRGAAEAYGTQLRTLSLYLSSDNMLASYYPAAHMSPLNDRQVAAVFWHFVNVTAPVMSMYERRPLDPSPMFQGRPVPKARQHIWTYTFPIIAFHHPALLQVMLALGSLQMATLQNAPTTASMKHYHLSLRRVAKNYRSPSKRTSAATLAATLLLGFYEVWNSDHEKWCKHLWGARAILKEIPLSEMTRDYLRTKRYMRGMQDAHSASDYGGAYYGGGLGDEPPDFFDNDVDGFNVRFLRRMTGEPSSFDSYTEALHPSCGNGGGQKLLSEKDIEHYENMVDLYWWYCKMDVYQSILGGTKLLMDYNLWMHVAPRSAIGRIDSIYGTYDHLVLLLGRLSQYAANDLPRKRRSGMSGAGPGGGVRPPGGAPPPAGGGGGAAPAGLSPPPFVGMMPTSGNFSVPAGFSPPREPVAQSAAADDSDMEESTMAALEEWESIRQAFDLFHNSLGPDFSALASEFDPPRPSPFGPALTYRTYSIAGVWLNYYMGLVLLYRSHPSMPPIAMVAAGMAAQQTGQYANTIGRITAGLVELTPDVVEITTVVGGILIESCFPVFVAGVQYQDHHQRAWTIERLLDVHRLTGWRSANQIAAGCESAWRKAASLKRGPPYERPAHLEQQSAGSVWSGPRKFDKRIKELADERARDGEPEGQLVLAKEERAHFALGLIAVERDLERLDLSHTD